MVLDKPVEPKGFPAPSTLKVIAGTERAQAAYPYYVQFSAADDNRFWFYNSMHFPEPMSAFDMVTAESARGRGLATLVVHELLTWAWSHGASHAYLQVNDDNAPALAVYRKFGFATAYTYHYRARPHECR